MEFHASTYAPPKYVMLANGRGSLRPPPYRRNVPHYPSKRPPSCLCKFIYGCCCCFFLFIILFLAVIMGLLAAYKPQIPSYNVDSFDVRAFKVQPNMSLFTKFAVTIKADNPNDHIGLRYGRHNWITVSYSGSELCSGKFPDFYQPRKNTTMMKIDLEGNSPFGSGLQEALIENRHTGRIPLLVQVKAPVHVVLDQFALWSVDVYVNCSLVIDKLSPDKKVKILSMKYNYWAEFSLY